MSHELPSDEVVRAAVARARVAVLDEIAQVRSPRRSTRFRTVRATLLASTAVVALSAGTLIVTSSLLEQTTTVSCYADASLEATAVSVQLPENAGETQRPEPAVLCAASWRSGDLGQKDPVTTGPDQSFPVPDLVSCTLGNDVGAAFPNRKALSAKELCGALGLAEWDSDLRGSRSPLLLEREV
jgi:hypothetical protein